MADLKLLGLDSEDLQVISAHLQDAVVRVADMGYAAGDHRFACLLNRFDWNAAAPRGKGGIRKRCALHFDRVDKVETAGFDPNAREGCLELLAITFESTDPPAGIIQLAFAGGGTVRLTAECLEVRMQDLGAAWAAKAVPQHAL